MIEISCQMCMDLMPLVHDGVASQDSIDAVQSHIQTCPDCKVLFEGQIPVPANADSTLKRIQSKVNLFMAMFLMFGLFFGLSLTASQDLFYNVLIMPLIGAVGYYLFRWKALFVVPGLLFVTHFATNTLGFGGEHLQLPSLLLWTGLYCIFALLGTLIAALLHFALKKEEKSNEKESV